MEVMFYFGGQILHSHALLQIMPPQLLTKLQTNYFFSQIGSLRNISFVENDTQCSGIYCLLSFLVIWLEEE